MTKNSHEIARADLAENIIARRRELGMTQEHLAEKSGITQAFVSKIESCKTDFAYRTLVDLANALETTVSDLTTPRRFSQNDA